MKHYIILFGVIIIQFFAISSFAKIFPDYLDSGVKTVEESFGKLNLEAEILKSSKALPIMVEKKDQKAVREAIQLKFDEALWNGIDTSYGNPHVNEWAKIPFPVRWSDGDTISGDLEALRKLTMVSTVIPFTDFKFIIEPMTQFHATFLADAEGWYLPLVDGKDKKGNRHGYVEYERSPLRGPMTLRVLDQEKSHIYNACGLIPAIEITRNKKLKTEKIFLTIDYHYTDAFGSVLDYLQVQAIKYDIMGYEWRRPSGDKISISTLLEKLDALNEGVYNSAILCADKKDIILFASNRMYRTLDDIEQLITTVDSEANERKEKGEIEKALSDSIKQENEKLAWYELVKSVSDGERTCEEICKMPGHTNSPPIYLTYCEDECRRELENLSQKLEKQKKCLEKLNKNPISDQIIAKKDDILNKVADFRRQVEFILQTAVFVTIQPTQEDPKALRLHCDRKELLELKGFLLNIENNWRKGDYSSVINSIDCDNFYSEEQKISGTKESQKDDLFEEGYSIEFENRLYRLHGKNLSAIASEINMYKGVCIKQSSD